MIRLVSALAGLPVLMAGQSMDEVKLIVLDPGHFHAALIQKEMYPWVSRRVAVYAPLGAELADYLDRVALFNARPRNPTAWELEVHSSPDYLERMLRDRAGNVVVMSGRNRAKIDWINASLEAGMNVLADKPWIIASADMGKLTAALESADRKGLIAYDIMTERYEITSILQRALVNDPAIFGKLLPGTAAEPGVRARSVHHIMKLVAGVPIRRSVWFFDVAEYGEGLADVGTHVVDLVQWTAFPERKIDYRADVRVLEGRHWPTPIGRAEFERVTGAAEFPQSVTQFVRDGRLDYHCNNSVYYTLRGVHVKLEILWNWEAPEGSGDVYEATFRGDRARAEIRQGREQKYWPELYVVPNSAALKPAVFAALRKRVEALQAAWPGLAVEEKGSEARIVIPEGLRVGHEAHFAQVTNRFFEYLKSPKALPAWEKPNMLAKYYVSTKGVELARDER